MGSDADDDDSGGSDYSGSESDGESSSVKSDSEEDEGLDWDEMEKQTINNENQRKAAALQAAR